MIAGAVAAGAATPPLEPCLRALWPRIVPPERLESAFALDSGAQELIFVTGPLLVAACAGAQSPSAALWLAAFLGLAGTLVVAAAPPSRAWTPPVGSAGWLGPLRSGPLVMLLISLVGAGAAVGGLTIMVVSYAERNPVPGGAGALLALNAGGALVGALVYGGVRWQAPPRRRAVLLAAGLATAYWLLCLPVPPVAMAALMAVTGLFLAPLLAVAFLLVDGLAPPGTTTEAFAWLVTLFAVGMALGTAIGGVLLQHSGQTAAAAAGAAGATGCALVLLAARRGLRLQPAT
ncbi:MFS transporter [Thermocatellispora tengchongensis]|uniref:MFS transporter n=1 Tax=Thermocatellispora tengchongensis TaxID=1073253 RepID=UPI0036346B91